MCIYSNYVSPQDRRNARVGENLTLGQYQGHACLRGDDGMITCIKPGTTMVVDNMQFNPAIGKPTLRLLNQYAGTSRAITLQRAHGPHYSADLFTLPIQANEDLVVSLEWIAIGTTFHIPRKVRKDKGVRKRNLGKVLGLDQIRADIPVRRKATAKVS
jgi:hypothetical protein